MKRCMTAIPLLLALGCTALQPSNLPAGCSFQFYMPEAATIQVLGDWNEWGGLTSAGGMLDPSSGSMILGSDGFWTLIVDLPRGRYRYAFLVDGTDLVADPLNPFGASFRGLPVSVRVIGD